MPLRIFAPPHPRRCSFGHGSYWSDAPGARHINAKGNPRYVCPHCAGTPGFKLPKGWKLA